MATRFCPGLRKRELVLAWLFRFACLRLSDFPKYHIIPWWCFALIILIFRLSTQLGCIGECVSVCLTSLPCSINHRQSFCSASSASALARFCLTQALPWAWHSVTKPRPWTFTRRLLLSFEEKKPIHTIRQ